MIDKILYPVVMAQPHEIHMLFSFGKMQTVTSCQHLANFFISVAVVLVADGAAVIIHPVVNDVTMRMITVSMPGYDELRVLNSHQLHIVMGDFQHQSIIVTDAVSVFCGEAQ